MVNSFTSGVQCSLCCGLKRSAGSCVSTVPFRNFRRFDPIERYARWQSRKTLSERDNCTKFITPAIKQAGWDKMTQIREEVQFTKGRIMGGKTVKRGEAIHGLLLTAAIHRVLDGARGDE